MKLDKLNLGKSLSKDEQKQIKGGTDTCNTGQVIHCACAQTPICGFATSDNESWGAICLSACAPYGGGGPAPGTYCNDDFCAP